MFLKLTNLTLWGYGLQSPLSLDKRSNFHHYPSNMHIRRRGLLQILAISLLSDQLISLPRRWNQDIFVFCFSPFCRLFLVESLSVCCSTNSMFNGLIFFYIYVKEDSRSSRNKLHNVVSWLKTHKYMVYCFKNENISQTFSCNSF